jgi:cysteine desulfurase family protein
MTDAPRRTVYLDHGASSWPKPPGVVEAVASAIADTGANPGRGAYAMGLAASRLIFEARRDAALLLGVPDSADLALLSGCTEGCNLMLKGVLRPGERVVVSSVEHNAVTRPLHVLELRGVRVEVVEADDRGVVDADRMEAAVRAEATRAVVCQHASNVTGAIQPIGDLADIAHAAGALLLVDGAQAAGHLPVDLGTLGADAWSTSGHKGLLGPQGVGLLYLAPDLDVRERTQGGTGGSSSEEPGQPTARPERYEAGTPNTPGIAGLGAAVRYVAAHADELRTEERRLARRLHEGLLAIDGMRVLGPEPGEMRVPIVSVVPRGADPDRVAFELDRRYGIAVRAGLHCSPATHRTLGTLETGAVRFGVGFGVTEADIDFAIAAMKEILA